MFVWMICTPVSLGKSTLKIRKNTLNIIYIVESELFVLPDMIDSPREFKMKIYRGSFANEKWGILIKDSMKAKITKIIYFRKLEPLKIEPKDTKIIVWSNDKEQFVTHYITGKPDFDQVIKVKTENKLISKQDNLYLVVIATTLSDS